MLRSLLRRPLILALGAFLLLGLLSLLPAGEEGAAGLALTRLGLALTAILALAVGAVPALRRLGGARRDERRLRCLEQLSLDSRHRLALIAVDGRELLVGFQGGGMVLLKDLAAAGPRADGASAADAAAGEDGAPAAGAEPAETAPALFREILRRRRIS
ncbi:MAG: flagellar biosynthetic protein FliO [Candidatus Krumholzibacteriota bacterium]|nr:flagellar biosynthetic protein FliO [Candidatus Krumholzibacteriota bacterium]